MNTQLTLLRFLLVSRIGVCVAVCFLVNAFSITTYANHAECGDPGLQLTPSEKSAINVLSEVLIELPAWVVVELLDAAGRVQGWIDGTERANINGANCTQATVAPPQEVMVNEILATSVAFKGKLCVVRCVFRTAVNVDRQLSLGADEHCWSVMLCDAKYLLPVQLFTLKPPDGFEKNDPVFAVGYFLACRQATLDDGDVAQVPVFVGGLRAAGNVGKRARGMVTAGRLLAAIVVLTVSYVAIRIYLVRSERRRVGRYKIRQREAAERKQR